MWCTPRPTRETLDEVRCDDNGNARRSSAYCSLLIDGVVAFDKCENQEWPFAIILVLGKFSLERERQIYKQNDIVLRVEIPPKSPLSVFPVEKSAI